MYETRNIRALYTHAASLGRDNYNVVEVFVAEASVDKIHRMVEWCSDYPLDQPFHVTAHRGRHRNTDRHDVYEVSLHFIDANAAFEAKLRFG